MSSTDKEKTIGTYNDSASELSDYFVGIGSRIHDIDLVFCFADKTNPQVLEIGCGSGRETADICKYTNNYLGMDVSSGMIKLARKANPGIKYEVADISEYKFPDNLGIVFAFASLLHLDRSEVRAVLKRLHKSLNELGLVYISLKLDTYHRFLKTDKFGERVFYYYTPEDIKSLAGDSYFVLYEDTQYIGHTNWFSILLQKQ